MKTVKLLALCLFAGMIACACGDDPVEDVTGGDGNNTSKVDGSIDGHDYIDLGLPSGTLWATCNVGASKPEDSGYHFAWGETGLKSDYNWSTYKYCNGSENTMTKYCTDSSCGTVDNKTELDDADDAAYIFWGSDWCMPTWAQLRELLNECTWERTTQKGKDGYLVTSKTNNHSIFLPCAGYRYNNDLYSVGSYGYYWSRTLYSDDNRSTYGAALNPYAYGRILNNRYYGQSVRPVRRK